MRWNTRIRTSLAAVIAVALAAQNALACTGIMLTNTDGSFVHGRTVEFGAAIDSSIAVVPRGHAFVGKTPRGNGLKYTAKYAAVGAVAFTDIKLLDGLNEEGLAVGAFYFPGFATYTAVTEENQTKGLSPGDFPNWLLTQFSSVGEVRKAIERGEAIITPTVIDNWGPESHPSTLWSMTRPAQASQLNRSTASLSSATTRWA
jgi:choloylglycine hydrolase